ncbi:MAG: hypothetical protein LDL11_01770 [Desulfarculus sp.]|nr:hypothetical protein [Desulfarculus sp.]
MRIAVGCLLALSLLAGGCAYTTVTAKERIPKPGPPQQVGLSAVMQPVNDRREWPAVASDQPIPNVRIFAPEMTQQLRQDLLASGLFAALPAPNSPAAKDIKPELRIKVTNFVITNQGTNAWIIPHLLIDGVALPVFTVTNVYSKGMVDLGGYLTPSTRIGVNLHVDLEYDEGPPAPLIKRSYAIRVEMDQVSERELLSQMRDYATWGGQAGREFGRKALLELARNIAADPNWKHLPTLRRLVAAEQAVKSGLPLDRQVAAAEEALNLASAPLTMTEEEVKILRDGYLDAKARATIVNDLRATWLGLSGPKDLSAEQTVSPEEAEAFFDDPRLPTYQMQSNFAQRAIALAVRILTPVEATPKEPGGRGAEVVSLPPGPRPPAAAVATGSPGTSTPDPTPAGAPNLSTAAEPPALSPAQAQALRQRLQTALAQFLAGDLRKQVLATNQADNAVGAGWQPMADLLGRVNTPYMQRYLQRRAG